MKSLKNTTLLQLVASASILLIASSIAYYFVLYLPALERAKQEQSQREFELKEKEQQIYKDCDYEAQSRATENLKSKVEVAEKSNLTYTSDYKIWKEASEKGLYLKGDYNELYDACLRRHGLKY